MKKKKKKAKLRVAIGIPSLDTVYADFTWSLINLCMFSQSNGIETIIINQKSSIIEVGRCYIADTAIQMDADKLWYIDTDMVFPINTLMRLLQHDKDIVSANYAERREPFTGVNRKIKDETGDLVKLEWAATGCLLIDTSVFHNISWPPFHVTWPQNDYRGEDLYFSDLVRKAGYDIWCDRKLSKEIGHIGSTTHYLQEGKEWMDKTRSPRIVKGDQR